MSITKPHIGRPFGVPKEPVTIRVPTTTLNIPQIKNLIKSKRLGDLINKFLISYAPMLEKQELEIIHNLAKTIANEKQDSYNITTSNEYKS